MVGSFADTLLLQPRVGPNLRRGTPRDFESRKVDIDAPGFFTALVDGFNSLQLRRLEERLPGDAHRLSFVRGSVVCDRLWQAQRLVARTYELFELPLVFRELSNHLPDLKVEALDRTLQRELIARLLRVRDPLGPTKLVFRLRVPDIAEIVAGGVEPVVGFLERVAAQNADVSKDVRSILEESGFGRSEPTVRFTLDVLLRRANRGPLANRCGEGGFDTLVRVLREERSLHPLLPLRTGAVPRVARALEIKASAAHELVTWLRLASLLQSRKSTELSDLSLKNLVVIPSPESDPAASYKHAEAALEQAHLALEDAVAEEPHLNDITARYPDVRRSKSAFALVLPKSLYEIFTALDSDQRVTFCTRLQIGQVSLARFLGEVRSVAARVIQVAWPGVCSLRVRAKTPGQRKIREIRPVELTPGSLRAQLEGALSDDSGETLRSLAKDFNRIMSDDRAAIARGLWSGP